MQTAIITLTFSPPDPRLVGIGPLIDPGGFIYRLHRLEDDSLRMSGTARGTDGMQAFHVAKEAARRAGFTHYLMRNTGGKPIPLQA